jgi:hypothetical protein
MKLYPQLEMSAKNDMWRHKETAHHTSHVE